MKYVQKVDAGPVGAAQLINRLTPLIFLAVLILVFPQLLVKNTVNIAYGINRVLYI